VPQLPSRAPIAGRDIRLGDGSVDVAAARRGGTYVTGVDTGSTELERLWIGHTLPRDASVRSVELDGQDVAWSERVTNRGLEVTVPTTSGEHEVVVKAG
jgi:hypothetical protein